MIECWRCRLPIRELYMIEKYGTHESRRVAWDPSFRNTTDAALCADCTDILAGGPLRVVSA